jgi:hypothetical protein
MRLWLRSEKGGGDPSFLSVSLMAAALQEKVLGEMITKSNDAASSCWRWGLWENE